MRRIKSKIYKWISSIPHRNMEDKGTEPISGSPAKSLPLTDWKKAFPMLSRYSSNTLLMKLGVGLIGFKFQRIYGSYRPLLVSYPLYEEDITFSVFIEMFYNKKHLTSDIPFEKHQQMFQDAMDDVKSQHGNLLGETVNVKDLFDLLKHKQKYDMLVCHNYCSLTEFLKYKLITALYLDNDALIQQVCMDMEEQTNSWDDIERFELFLGKLPVWKDKFYQLIDQREEIMERIRINSMDKRIAKLKESHLII